MRVKGKFAADVVQFNVRRNKTNDGQEAEIDIDIGVRQEESEKWGEDFAALAFATMRTIDAGDAGAGVGFLVDRIKPGSRVVFERHRVELEDQVFECQPELTTIKTCDGEARVVATVRIPIDVGRDKLLASLVKRVGQTVRVDFAPSQGSFEFQAMKRGKEQAAEAEAEA